MRTDKQGKKQYYKYNNRPDHKPGHRTEYERNRKRILQAQNICAICGEPVDKSLKYPHPYCATVDHIIPVSKGGHPSDIENLQLAHFKCNRAKADNIAVPSYLLQNPDTTADIDSTTPEGLPQTIDWNKYEIYEDGSTNAEELLKEAEALKASGLILTARYGVIKAKRNGKKL